MYGILYKASIIIKEFEGFSATAYYCPANILTIGYGRTIDVKEGDTTTKDIEDQWIMDHIEVVLMDIIPLLDIEITDNQYSALVSFCYNIGIDAFRKSTLRKKINIGDMAAAAMEFRRWNKAGGRVLKGLDRRREVEERLFVGYNHKKALKTVREK